MSFTAQGIQSFQPRARPYEIPETGNPGFVLRVHPTGRKVWVYRYRINGRLRRITLGVYREDRHGVSLAEARRRYFAARTLRESGADPRMFVIARLRRSGRPRTVTAKRWSVAALIEHHIEESRSGADKKRSWAADAANLKRDIPTTWLERRPSRLRALRCASCMRRLRNERRGLRRWSSPRCARHSIVALRRVCSNRIRVIDCAPRKRPRARGICRIPNCERSWPMSAQAFQLITPMSRCSVSGLRRRRNEVIGLSWAELDLGWACGVCPALEPRMPSLMRCRCRGRQLRSFGTPPAPERRARISVSARRVPIDLAAQFQPRDTPRRADAWPGAVHSARFATNRCDASHAR